MIIALGLSGEPSVKRGIYDDLAEAFDLNQLVNIKSRELFEQRLPEISSKSKRYFLLSSIYFDSGTQGNLELLSAFTSFTAPHVLSGVDLSIQAREISFSAWIRIHTDFTRGYVVQ